MSLAGLHLTTVGAIGVVVFLVLSRQIFSLFSFSDKGNTRNAPPLIDIAPDDLVHSPVESMTRALQDHGPIVGVKRNGNTEYLVSKEYTRRLLTDESAFSFEQGVAKVLGLDWIFNLHGGTFVRDMDSLVREYLARRLNHLVPQMWPIFERGAKAMVDDGMVEPVDILPHVQNTMGQATISIFLGKRFDREEYVKSVVDIAEDIAELLGIFKNNSILRGMPLLWRTVTWLRIIVLIPWHIGPRFGWALWTDVSRTRDFKTEEDTIVSFLARRYASPDGSITFTSRLWMMVLLLAIIFASLHQTVTTIIWVTFFLAQHQDSQTSIRAEVDRTLLAHGYNGELSFKTIQKAVMTDSFVREVLRMKGDTASLVRVSIKDVPLAGYMIPKGSILIPITYLSFRSKDFLPDPDEFNAERWVGTRRSAATTGPGYLPFGLGRWSCPGRLLATTEIKCWLLALSKCGRFELQGNKYEVLDAHNVTSVPPQGRLVFDL